MHNESDRENRCYVCIYNIMSRFTILAKISFIGRLFSDCYSMHRCAIESANLATSRSIEHRSLFFNGKLREIDLLVAMWKVTFLIPFADVMISVKIGSSSLCHHHVLKLFFVSYKTYTLEMYRDKMQGKFLQLLSFSSSACIFVQYLNFTFRCWRNNSACNDILQLGSVRNPFIILVFLRRIVSPSVRYWLRKRVLAQSLHVRINKMAKRWRKGIWFYSLMRYCGTRAIITYYQRASRDNISRSLSNGCFFDKCAIRKLITERLFNTKIKRKSITIISFFDIFKWDKSILTRWRNS